MCAWFEPGTGVPQVVHAFGTRLYTLCASHRGGIQVPDGRRTRPTGLDPRALQSRLVETYAVDLLPEEAVRSLFGRPPTVSRPSFPSISVVPVAEAGDSGEQSGIDAIRSLLGWPRRRGPDYNE